MVDDSLPGRIDEDGQFPFGQPNGPRQWSGNSKPKQLVIGVYPSALHVQWRAPAELAGDGGVAALAVEVEPEVFWSAQPGDAERRIQAWKEAVRFRAGDGPDCDGTLGASPGTNGSSGAKLDEFYFKSLGYRREETAFLDVYPVFMVKSGSAARRGQADAIEHEYDAIASRLGRTKSSLPRRPSNAKLVERAVARFGPWIVGSIRRLEPKRIVTLGVEPWETLKKLDGLKVEHRSERFEETYGPLYGTPGTITVDGREIEWIPLVHPGLLKGQAPLDWPEARSIAGWVYAHELWRKPRA